ncbi:MAG TPA: extracellular solute-binding protein [Methylomirabilota bacterium]|jgi:multiple sugar transport system substrate-binding protein
MGSSQLSRRTFLKGAGVAATVAAGPTVFVRASRAQGKTLKIAQWTHFVPAFDDWFDKKFTKEWGEKNGVHVTVDHISVNDLRARAAAEVGARKGHDLFGFLDPPPAYEDQVLSMNDVVSELEKKFGKPINLVQRATYNPRTKNYFALSDNWVPDPLHYRIDWWGEVGVKPDTWDHVREGARKIKEKLGHPAGFGISQELDTNMMLRGLLWGFGAHEQDESSTKVTINSKGTVDAIKLMTAIYKESMTNEVFTWDPSGNNRFFVSGKGSIIQNAISAIRTAEKQNPELAKKMGLAPPAAGPKTRMGSEHLLHCYVVWKFAENPDLAKKFIMDLVASYNDAFLASEFYNFPSFPKSVTDLRGKLAADKFNPQAYLILADAEKWSAYPGYPGHTTAAIDEVFNTFVIPNMFARVAKGEQSAEDSAKQAEAEMQRIFAKWGK